MAELKRNILICIDWFDPAYKAGGPVQSCKNLVRHLGGQFEFYILTSDKDAGDTAPLNGVRFNEWTQYAPHVQVYYSQGRADTERLIQEVQPAVIYFNSMYSWPFTIRPLLTLRRMKNAPRIILAPRGMLQEGAMKFKRNKKLLFLRLIRLLRLERRILFHATDAQERSDILRYFPKAGGVFEAVNFPAMENPEWRPAVKAVNTLKCVFLSRIVPKKNLLFLIKLLGNIPEAYSISLDVWGAAEDEAYAAACRQATGALPAHVQVFFKGPVKNDELTVLYRQYHVFVLATHGENFGHVIYEALLRGLPVIISNRTPWTALQTKQVGYDLPVDNESAWLEALTAFAAMNQEQYNQWSKNAWQFAKKYKTDNSPEQMYITAFGA